jgi:hypothetical protein
MVIALPIAITSFFLQPRFISPSVLYDTLKVPCLISSYEAKSIVAIAIGFATALGRSLFVERWRKLTYANAYVNGCQLAGHQRSY